MPKIFISHTADDKPLADALKTLLHGSLGESFSSLYSTDDEPGGGIEKGADWRKWIRDTVAKSERTLVVLTPASLSKPWVIWEAGAVIGVNIAAQENPVMVPITYGLRASSIPSPLAAYEAVKGDDKNEMRQLLTSWAAAFQSEIDLPKFSQNESRLAEYHQTVNSVMEALPIEATEAAIQEWIERLDELRARGGSGRVRNLHHWIQIAFRGEEAGHERPLDGRIHRRLGEMYLDSGNAQQAIKQFQLASELSPRDLFVRRYLGQAYLSAAQIDEAENEIERIRKLDFDAFRASPDCAGLLGRFHRARFEQFNNKRELFKAQQAYRHALDADPSSIYLAENLAQVSLLLDSDDTDQSAEKAYEIVLGILAKTRGNDVWANASRANACLYLGELDKGAAAIDSIRVLMPSPGELESIERGLDTVFRHASARNSYADSVLGAWKRRLRETAQD